MITNEILVKNTLNIKPNTLEDYTINIMNMLGVDIDYSSMFKEKNKIVDKSTGKVVCERKIVSADTFIKLKSKYSDGYRMSYEIYIFDDSFSALDYKTDATLRTQLKKYTKEATNLIVAQRIGSIMDADKIIVLDEGKVVGVGKHKELLKTCNVYHEIALSQLTEEELA